MDSAPGTPSAPEAAEEKLKIFSEGRKGEGIKNHPEIQDAALCMAERGVFGVFDGRGKYGKNAAEIVKGETESGFVALRDDLPLDQLKQQMGKALEEGGKKIFAEGKDDKDKRNMGASAAVVKIWQGPAGEKKAVVGSVGDSRVSIIHADGKLEAVTLDDLRIYSGLDDAHRRELQEKLGAASDPASLDIGLRASFGQREELQQWLGGGPKVTPRMVEVDIKAGDRLILTTAGIHKNLTDGEIARIVEDASRSNENPTKKLADAAEARGKESGHLRAKPDDMTAVMVALGESASEPAPATPEERDKIYADKFWERYKDRETLVTGMKEVWKENLEASVKSGVWGELVGPEGITEEYKEKLSAVREFAKTTGYEVGEFVFNKDSHTVTATVKKKEQSATEASVMETGAVVPGTAVSGESALAQEKELAPEEPLVPIVEAMGKWLRLYALMAAGKEGAERFEDKLVEDYLERTRHMLDEYAGSQERVNVKDFIRARLSEFLANEAVKESYPQIAEAREKNPAALQEFVDKAVKILDEPPKDQGKKFLELWGEVNAKEIAKSAEELTRQMSEGIREQGDRPQTPEEIAAVKERIEKAEGSLDKLFKGVGQMSGLLLSAMLLGFLLILMLEIELAKKFVEKTEKGKGFF